MSGRERVRSVAQTVKRATLVAVPELTEYPSKGTTPRAACQGHVAQRVSTKCLILDRVSGSAFAYPQHTRAVGTGQRTGRAVVAQGRVGAQA